MLSKLLMKMAIFWGNCDMMAGKRDKPTVWHVVDTDGKIIEVLTSKRAVFAYRRKNPNAKIVWKGKL